MQRIPIVENAFRHTQKQLDLMLLSHVTVADSDSSDSSRLYPNERYRPERYRPERYRPERYESI